MAKKELKIKVLLCLYVIVFTLNLLFNDFKAFENATSFKSFFFQISKYIIVQYHITKLTLNIGVDGVAPFRVGVGVLVLFADGFGVFVELVPGVAGGVAA